MDTNLDAVMDLDTNDAMDYDPDDPIIADSERIRHQVPRVIVEDNHSTRFVEDPSAITPKPSAKSKAQTLSLRTLPQSSRHFWKPSHPEQVSQSMNDHINGSDRSLPKNEIAVMALNEIAAERGQGFFFHLTSRECWYKFSKEELSPKLRLAPRPGAHFPNAYYMRYTWTDKSRASFFQKPHRSRYLMCDGLINPPLRSTPLYAIQNITGPLSSVYITSPESLVVLANTSTFFLTKTSELEELIGLWPKSKRPPQGPDPKLRINTTPYIWKDDTSEQAIAMTRFKVPGIEKLYEEIVKRCKPENGPENLVSTFTAQEFGQIIPRPSITNIGVALGTPLARSEHRDSSDIDEEAGKRKASDLAGVNDSSNPPSRREIPLKKARAGRKSGIAGGRTGTSLDPVQQHPPSGSPQINRLIGVTATQEARHRPTLGMAVVQDDEGEDSSEGHEEGNQVESMLP